MGAYTNGGSKGQPMLIEASEGQKPLLLPKNIQPNVFVNKYTR